MVIKLIFTATQEAKLAEIARDEGKSVGHLLIETATNLLKTESRRWEEIDHAVDQIARGEFLEEEEMDARVTRMLAR